MGGGGVRIHAGDTPLIIVGALEIREFEDLIIDKTTYPMSRDYSQQRLDTIFHDQVVYFLHLKGRSLTSKIVHSARYSALSVQVPLVT